MSQTLTNTLPASEENCPHCGAAGGSVYCPSGCAQGREEDA